MNIVTIENQWLFTADLGWGYCTGQIREDKSPSDEKQRKGLWTIITQEETVKQFYCN